MSHNVLANALVKMPLSWICLKVKKFTQFFMLQNISLFGEMMTFQSCNYPLYLLKTNLKWYLLL